MKARKLDDDYAVRFAYDGSITIFPYIENKDGEIISYRHASGVTLSENAVDELIELLKGD